MSVMIITMVKTSRMSQMIIKGTTQRGRALKTRIAIKKKSNIPVNKMKLLSKATLRIDNKL